MVAVSYGVTGKSNNAAYDIGYITPEMVTNIPDVIPPPKPGPLEVANEIPTLQKVYYDGGAKLNKIDVDCKIYANPTNCINQSYCGWCGSLNTCVFGNKNGPYNNTSCLSGFMFSPPQPNWQPQTRFNENVGGVQLTVISK